MNFIQSRVWYEVYQSGVLYLFYVLFCVSFCVSLFSFRFPIFSGQGPHVICLQVIRDGIPRLVQYRCVTYRYRAHYFVLNNVFPPMERHFVLTAWIVATGRISGNELYCSVRPSFWYACCTVPGTTRIPEASCGTIKRCARYEGGI